jgi:hypothetical protein
VTTGRQPGADETRVVLGDDRGAVIDMDQPPDERQLALPWRRIGLVVVLLALAAGGYAATRGGVPAAPPTDVSQPSPVTAQALQPTGNQCGMSDSTVLQVGATLTNLSGSPVTAEAVILTSPTSGLRLRDEGWGQCAQTPVPTGPLVVQPGETFWFNATFDLLAKCPAVGGLDFTVLSRVDGVDVSTLVVVDDPTGDLPDCGPPGRFGGSP